MLKLKCKIIYGEKYAGSPFTHISLAKQGRSLREDPINKYKSEFVQYFWDKGSVFNIIMFKSEAILSAAITSDASLTIGYALTTFLLGQHTVI